MDFREHALITAWPWPHTFTLQQASQGGSRGPTWNGSWSLNPAQIMIIEPRKHIHDPSCTPPQFNFPFHGASRLHACSSHPGHEKHRGTPGGAGDRAGPQQCLRQLIFPLEAYFTEHPDHVSTWRGPSLSLGRAPRWESLTCDLLALQWVGQPQPEKVPGRAQTPQCSPGSRHPRPVTEALHPGVGNFRLPHVRER